MPYWSYINISIFILIISQQQQQQQPFSYNLALFSFNNLRYEHNSQAQNDCGLLYHQSLKNENVALLTVLTLETWSAHMALYYCLLLGS